MPDQIGTPFDVSELKACALCGKGMMHSRDVVFYEVNITQCVVDLRSAQRLHGLEMMMGGAVGIARALSPDTAIARRLEPAHLLICQPCFIHKEGLAEAFEAGNG